MIFCPVCKSDQLIYDGTKQFNCPECNWIYFHNIAAAVAVIIEHNGEFLAVRRNRPPKEGMLDLPGGFVDPGESSEEAAIREIKEELGIELGELNYLCSAPNTYEYKGIGYNTCDNFYLSQVTNREFGIKDNEISELVWLSLNNLKINDFAFDSIKKGLECFKAKHI